jgi:hypothetical protein
MYAPTPITFEATAGSPIVFSPGPLLPAEMNIWTLLSSIRRL